MSVTSTRPHWIRLSDSRAASAALTLVSLVCGCSGVHSRHAGAVGQASATDLVDLAEYDLRIKLDLRYATDNNFAHQRLYPASRALLRARVAERLKRVQDRLVAKGLGLKVHDAYRPLSVQKRLWKLVPDENFVANPAKGSRHNRGAAVDVTLVDTNGLELEMPTAFDDFTPAAHRDFQGASPAAPRPCHTIASAG